MTIIISRRSRSDGEWATQGYEQSENREDRYRRTIPSAGQEDILLHGGFSRKEDLAGGQPACSQCSCESCRGSLWTADWYRR